MEEFYKSHKILFYFVIALVLISLSFIWIVPEYYVYRYFKFPQDKEKLEAIKDIRAIIVQILAGILAVIGLILTWRRTRSNEANVKATAEQTKEFARKTDEDKKANDDKLVLDQFTKASELLKDDAISAKLSGIYLFEKIMNSREDYHWEVIELLTAYVREERKNNKFLVEEGVVFDEKTMVTIYKHDWDKEKQEELLTGKCLKKEPIDECIQAILTVLDRREMKFEQDKKYENRKIDLSNTNLYKADLSFKPGMSTGSFTKFNFDNSILAWAECHGTHFEYAQLKETHFEHTQLYCIHFDYAWLDKAHFEYAWFDGAYFEYAHLIEAHFEYAQLSNIYFKNTSLDGAHFEYAFLHNLNFKNAYLFEANLKSIILKPIPKESNEGKETALIYFIRELNKARNLTEIEIDDYILAKIKEIKPELLERIYPKKEEEEAVS